MHASILVFIYYVRASLINDLAFYSITRKFQDGIFVYEDTYGEPPACNIGSIQCGEFVYKEEISGMVYYCRSVSSGDISTLKTLLAASTEFDASCNPNE